MDDHFVFVFGIAMQHLVTVKERLLKERCVTLLIQSDPLQVHFLQNLYCKLLKPGFFH